MMANDGNGRPSCLVRKPNGTPCKAAPEKGGRVCYFHDPAHAAARKAAQRRGGLGNRTAPPGPQLPDFRLNSAGNILGLLEGTVNDLLRGSISPKTAATLVYAADVMQRAFHELRIEQRLAALEAVQQNHAGRERLYDPTAGRGVL